MVFEWLSGETKWLHFADECRGKLKAITFDLRTKLPLNCIVNKRIALSLHDHVDDDDDGSKMRVKYSINAFEHTTAPTTKTQTFNFLSAAPVCTACSMSMGMSKTHAEGE